MSDGARFDVRPPQRGKHGFVRLAREPRPSFSDVMIDSARFRIAEKLLATDTDKSNAIAFERHKNRLIEASRTPSAFWKCPPAKSTRSFTIEFLGDHSTLNASQRVELDQDGLSVAVVVQVNPTRTLRHLLARAPQDEPFARWIGKVSAETFFAKTPDLQPLQTVDGNDNALTRLDQPRHLLGADFMTVFLSVFEAKLADWTVSAIAVDDLEIRMRQPSGIIELASPTDRMTFDWTKITPYAVETYIERRHSSADDLMERLKDDVQSSQSSAAWRRYGINEISERFGNAIVVGTDLTNNIERKLYAKTKERLRIETRYNNGVLNSLRLQRQDLGRHPLATVCNAARTDTIKRLEWDAICDLCLEPKRAALVEAINMIASIGEEARAHSLPAGPITFALISTGGVEPTAPDGAYPLSLLQALEKRGFVSRENFQRRRRPGQAYKFHLTEEWMEVSRRMRKAFREE